MKKVENEICETLNAKSFLQWRHLADAIPFEEGLRQQQERNQRSRANNFDRVIWERVMEFTEIIVRVRV